MVLLYKNRISFLFKLLFFGLSINYFMVYFFKGVVRLYIEQTRFQITILVYNVCYVYFVSI